MRPVEALQPAHVAAGRGAEEGQRRELDVHDVAPKARQLEQCAVEQGDSQLGRRLARAPARRGRLERRRWGLQRRGWHGPAGPIGLAGGRDQRARAEPPLNPAPVSGGHASPRAAPAGPRPPWTRSRPRYARAWTPPSERRATGTMRQRDREW